MQSETTKESGAISGLSGTKLAYGAGFQPFPVLRAVPGALPQADIGRAFGPPERAQVPHGGAEGVSPQPGARPEDDVHPSSGEGAWRYQPGAKPEDDVHPSSAEGAQRHQPGAKPDMR